MAASVNKIKNADFASGKDSPRGWAWTADGSFVQSCRLGGDRGEGLGGVMLTSDRAAGGSWSQTVTCKPGKHYRVEATVTCEAKAPDDRGGFVLTVSPANPDAPVGEPLETPGLHCVMEATDVRTLFRAPADVRRLCVSVGLAHAEGWVCIHEVRVIEILEPEGESHALAIPPPPTACPPPRNVRSVAVCSASSEDRPITQLLRRHFGDARVRSLPPDELGRRTPNWDALLLPDPVPPRSIRSFAALAKLAADRIVVISLPAFATLTRGALSMRRVAQDDDPIHAKVAWGNFATQGFALDDAFPYAWRGKLPGSFVQHQYRKTTALNTFCKKHGFETLLTSVCDQDVTTGRPVCLHRATPKGALFVLDIEPAEAPPSTFGEPNLATHLLLAILAQRVRGLGQYVVPHDGEADFRSALREAALRFEHFEVHDADVPAEEVTEQIVTIGREDRTFGLPITPKPVVILRSGLTSGDMESVYGALLFFKQLVRGEPHRCPYAGELASRFRLAWVPCVAAWESQAGWRRRGAPPSNPMEVDTDGSRITALIDVVSRPIQSVRVSVGSDDAHCDRYRTWLPRLAEAFLSDHALSLMAADDAPFSDRSAFEWRRGHTDVRVDLDADLLSDPAHRDVLDSGGQVIRIEVPGSAADFPACSIQRTDVTATLIEHVIGLLYGLIAVNRGPAPVQLDGFPPVAPGGPLIVDSADPMLRLDTCQAG